jgi:transposase
MADDTIIETIGCDLGDKTSELCLLTAGSQVQWPGAITTTRKAFGEFFRGRSRAHVVLEVGTHSRWVSKLLEKLGHKVTVANPRRLQLITQSLSKRDKKDAELLARLGRADEALLSPVVHRGTQAQADLAVAKARDGLVRARTSLVNHIRGTVKSFGERLPKCSTASFAKKAREHVPAELKPALEPVFVALEALNQQIAAHDKTLEQLAKKYPDVVAVSQPKGVGILTALVFLLTLEDKRRFQKSRTVGAFVGLTPRRDQSGDTDKQLGITKAGDTFLRRLAVESANYILGPFGEDSDLRRWGLQMAQRGGKNAKRRAKVAVARKLVVLMHRLWVSGEVYQPLGYNQQKPSQRTAA